MNATLIRFPFSQHLSRTLFKTVYLSASVYRCILINIISLDNNINFLLHRKRATLKAAKLTSIYTIIFTTYLIGSSDPKPSNNNTPVTVGGENALYMTETRNQTHRYRHTPQMVIMNSQQNMHNLTVPREPPLTKSIKV